MLKLTCLCGQVRIEVAKRPDFINGCNCTLCSKSGARWSYFHPSEVSIEGATREYSWEDKDDPAAEIHFCGRCGSTTHFTLTESAISKFGNVQTGVNMSLADESDLVESNFVTLTDGLGRAGPTSAMCGSPESLAKARLRNDYLRGLPLRRKPN
jgi:hypothetical protein